jgi:hypothetical protein
MKDRELPYYGSPLIMKKANQAAKKSLDEDISITERYPPDDLKKWLTEEDFKKRDQRWKNGNNEMKERKPDVDIKEDRKEMPRKEQVGHPRSQDGRGQQSTVPFCNTVYLSTTYCGNAKKLWIRERTWT